MRWGFACEGVQVLGQETPNDIGYEERFNMRVFVVKRKINFINLLWKS